MTIFFLENGIIDDEIYLLKQALDLYDVKIRDIDDKITRSSDPDSDGFFDLGEYFIGLGFIAIQCYFDAVINQFNLEKKDALSLPPKYEDCDASFAELINAGANHAKHQNEWWNTWFQGKNLSSHAMQNCNSILKISRDVVNYPKSIIIAEILRPQNAEEFTLSRTIPIIEQWRNEIIRYSKKQH